MDENYMTTHEAAKRLGLALSDLYRLVDQGQLSAWLCPAPRQGLEHRQVIRVPRDEVEALLKSR